MRISNAVTGLSVSDLRRDRHVFPFGLYLPTRTLVFEFRAESLRGADGSAISEWPSFSRPYANPTGVGGSGNWAGIQATGTKQPVCKTNILNGYPVARFDGTDDFFNIPNTGSGMGNFSYFAVFKVSDTVQRTLFAGDNSSAQIQINTNKIFLHKVANSTLGSSTAALNTTDFFTIAVTYDRSLASNHLKFYINGVLDTQVTGTTELSVGNLYIGTRNNGAETFKGDMAHHAFYYSAVNSLELDRIHHVLRTLYRHY